MAGTLTLANLRDEVRAGLGNRSEFVSDTTRVDRWINQAQTRICRRVRFDELNFSEDKVLTAHTAVLAWSALVNSNIRGVYSIRVLDGTRSQKLRYVPHRLWDRRVAKTDEYTEELPGFYTSYNKQFEWWRIPNQAYTIKIRGAKWPTVLSTTGQTSDLSEKDDMIVAASVYTALLSLGQYKNAAAHFNEYKTLLSEAKIENDDNPDMDSTRGNETAIGDYWVDPFQRSAPE